jgi:hypothetical protein
LPAKPWLILAFVLLASTGEVLINVTNLQWVTAFLLLLQLFTRPAENVPQRLGDLAILVLVGLNGPFALVFLPLFAWRAWRERNLDTIAALAAITLCAVVQGWHVAHNPLSLEGGSEALRPFALLTILGTRLLTWPVLGPEIVRALPKAVHAAVALLVIGPFLVWTLRRHPLRATRARLVAALALITLAALYRVRPDTWQTNDLVNGDRYFYIPRVLFAWLVILEFDAVPRAIGWAARALCVVGVLTHLPHFMLPAPPDYKWTEHCDPIRRGVRADIKTLPEGWWIEYQGRPGGK